MSRSVCQGSLIQAIFYLSVAVLLLSDACEAGFDFKNILKRRPMSSRRLSETGGDAEASAHEARQYHTACDQELARSLVILGEQKEVSEAALDSCKSQREKALENAEFLSKKVEIIAMSLDESEHRCQSKLHDVKRDADAKLEELEMKLEIVGAKHEEDTLRLIEAHKSSMEQLMIEHEDEIKKQMEAAEARIYALLQEKEDLVTKIQKERKSAKATEEKTLLEHKKTLDEVESKWKLTLAEKEANLSTCNDYLSETIKAKEALEYNYERSLQKIAVLENVTAYTLAVEEARDVADFALKLIIAMFHPPYDKHLKKNVESVIEFKERIKVMLEPLSHSLGDLKPMLDPVVQTINTEYEKLKTAIQAWSRKRFDDAKGHFIANICTQRTNLKHWEKQHELEAHISRVFDEACEHANEFLVAVGWGFLILLAWTLRRYILRAVFAILLIPIRIFILPFSLMLKSVGGENATAKKHR